MRVAPGRAQTMGNDARFPSLSERWWFPELTQYPRGILMRQVIRSRMFAHIGKVKKRGPPGRGIKETAIAPRPRAARPGEIRKVRLRASAVNPSDVKARAVSGTGGLEGWSQLIPNEADSPCMIDRVGVGKIAWRLRSCLVQRSMGSRAPHRSRQYIGPRGGPRRSSPKPESLSWEQGACLGIPVMTAHRCLFADGLGQRQNRARHGRCRRGSALRIRQSG